MFNLKKLIGIFVSCALLWPNYTCQSKNRNSNNNSVEKSVVEVKKDENITLNLEGTKNTRDLGGYKTIDGKTTKSKLFFRSDNTHKLTDVDIKKLKDEYNLKYVIDLRSAKEIDAYPDKLSNAEGVDYYSIQLSVGMKYLIKHNLDLGDGYIKLLDRKKKIKSIFDLIANVNGGSLLFHCAHGKDRTGVVAALLLGLCGVSEEDIIKDYCITYDLIKSNNKTKKDTISGYMKKMLSHISNNYKNVENYLLECGVSEENIKNIKDMFTC
ncbi:MAG: tyrosine-protein phosphatase [Clostridia bacterium]|nr:tyrosine-protein phosphatase [Clostridia bacterium]